MIICDIDGVVCDNTKVATFDDWERTFDTMEPNSGLIKLLSPVLGDVMFVTGRSEKYRERTMAWFQVHWPEAIERSMGFQFRPLDQGSTSSDDLKRAAVKRLKAAGYPEPTLAIDDVGSNCRTYRDMGIPSMQHLVPMASEFEDLVDSDFHNNIKSGMKVATNEA